MSFPNHGQNPDQQIPLQEVQQPTNFINNQQPFQGHINATPPPIQQQQQQEFPPQQAYYPPIPNAQQQSQPMPQYAQASPLAQGQEPAAPLKDGHAGAASAGSKDRKNSLVRAKLQFKGRDIWIGGESSVGRKDKDGKWTEARGCSVM